jgi:hypothetical protein
MPPPDFAEDFKTVVGFLQDDNTDARVVAIVALSYLEEYLERAIYHKMPGLNADLKDKLFKGYGPLSTMSAKIDVAAALNLIPHVCRKDYILLTRVRNRFAHKLSVTSFDHPDIVALCAKLRGEATFETNPIVVEHAKAMLKFVKTPRGRFVMASINYCMQLSNFLNRISRPVHSNPD